MYQLKEIERLFPFLEIVSYKNYFNKCMDYDIIVRKNNRFYQEAKKIKKLPKELLDIKKYFNINEEDNIRFNFNDFNLVSINGLRLPRNVSMDLKSNNISVIKDVVLDGFINLSFNKISCVKNINQKNKLNLSFNKIKSIDGFVQAHELLLYGNPIDNLFNFKFSKDHAFRCSSNPKVEKKDIDLQKFLDKNRVKYQIVQEKYKDL